MPLIPGAIAGAKVVGSGIANAVKSGIKAARSGDISGVKKISSAIDNVHKAGKVVGAAKEVGHIASNINKALLENPNNLIALYRLNNMLYDVPYLYNAFKNHSEINPNEKLVNINSMSPSDLSQEYEANLKLITTLLQDQEKSLLELQRS